MLYRKIINDAWQFTNANTRLVKWYALAPAILTTIVGILTVIYQYMAFKTSEVLFDNVEETFLGSILHKYLDLLNTDTKLGIILTIIAFFIYIGSLFIPILCQGALIQLIARSKNGEEIKIRNGVQYGMLYFLQLFEYSLILKTFALHNVVETALFIIRNLGWGFFQALLIPLILFLCISLLLTLFITYSEYFIVIDNKKVFESIKASTMLVIKNWQYTFLILILMVIIGIRIIVNVLIILLIPGIIIGITAIFVYNAALIKLGAIIAGIVGLFALYFASYFNAVLDVWAKTVWVYSFLEMTTNKETNARGEIIQNETQEGLLI